MSEVSLQVWSAMQSWFQRVYQALEQEAHQQGIDQFPSPELQKLLKAVQEDLIQISHDLKYDVSVRPYEIFRELMERPIVSQVVRFFCDGMEVLNNIHSALQQSLRQVIMMWQQKMKYIYDVYQDGKITSSFLISFLVSFQFGHQ